MLIATTKERKVLVTGHDSGYLLLFDLKEYKVEIMKKIAESKIFSLVELGDEALIAAGSYDSSVVIFNLINKTI